MSGRGVKFRAVIAWMAVMLFAVSILLAHVWKQQAHTRFSRELAVIARDRDALATEILLLETETRGLRQYSRIEAMARQRLGLINPGPPVMIPLPGHAPAGSEPREGASGAIRSARWKGFFR